jgi:hypothetical protein
MSEVPARTIQLRWLGVGMAGLLLSGCAGALTNPEDLICQEGDADCAP